MVNQLKKEQKKRHKERLKAQEASLLKQLEVRQGGWRQGGDEAGGCCFD